MKEMTRWPQHTQTGKLTKWLAEVAIWKEILNARKEENILLKDGLADILRYNYNRDHLEEIENFQNKFILEDEIGHVLRIELFALDDLLDSKTLEKEELPGSLEETIEKLGNDIAYSETRFGLLASSFTDFQQKVRAKNEK